MTPRPFIAGLVAASTLLSVALAVSSQADTVNIYSTRQADLIEPVLDAFTAETGIDTRVLFVKKGLVDRLVAEGAGSPADVLLTTDIGGLLDFVNEGVTQPVTSSTIAANVPATLRDEDDHWFALTKRGRVVYASVDRVEQDSIEEVILALTPSVEGDTTSLYLARMLKPFTQVSRIAYGLPVGSELEYADDVTLSRALEGRRAVE